MRGPLRHGAWFARVGRGGPAAWSAAVLFLACGAVLVDGADAASRGASGAADRLVQAPAGETPAATKPAPESSANPAGAKGYILQDLDEPLEPFVPKKPVTAKDLARKDALAWYMSGQLHESRNEFKEALEDYRRSLQAEPDALAVLRAIVPIAFSLDQTEEALRHALRAVELDPNDYELLRRLGVHMASERKLPEAIQLLEKAVRSSALKKDSGAYVTLNRDLGILYAATGQTKQAADAYEVVFRALTEPQKFDIDPRTRAALEADPRSAFERIGQIFLEAERPERAVAAFEQAAKAGKGNPGSLSYNLARVYLQTKQPQKALDELQKYLDAELQSKGKAAYQLLADILKALDKSNELVPRLEKLAEKDARNALLQFFLADQYAAAGELDKAEALYKKTLESTGNADGYLGLAAIHRRRNRPEQLLEALSQAVRSGRDLESMQQEIEAIEADEKLLDALIAVGRAQLATDPPKLDFPGRLILGKLAAQAKKSDAAIEFYRAALKDARREQAFTLYEELGQHLLEVKNYAEAAKIFRQASVDPALSGAKPNFLFRLSQAEELRGETNAALAAVQEARTLVPDSPLLHYQEGWIHYHAHQFDAAVRIFEQVLATYPQQKEIVRRCQFSLSNVYVQQGQLRKGEEILERILAEEPDDVSVNNDLGYLYADQGKNLEQAEKMIRKAVAAEPDNAAYQDSLGWVLFKLGRFEEAVAPLEKASKNPAGGDGTIWDHLGDCYERLKRGEDAVRAWEKALKAAREESRPDAKLIGRLEEKLKARKPAGP